MIISEKQIWDLMDLIRDALNTTRTMDWDFLASELLCTIRNQPSKELKEIS